MGPCSMERCLLLTHVGAIIDAIWAQANGDRQVATAAGAEYRSLLKDAVTVGYDISCVACTDDLPRARVGVMLPAVHDSPTTNIPE